MGKAKPNPFQIGEDKIKKKSIDDIFDAGKSQEDEMAATIDTPQVIYISPTTPQEENPEPNYPCSHRGITNR
jgi:hypothetical protein